MNNAIAFADLIDIYSLYHILIGRSGVPKPLLFCAELVEVSLPNLWGSKSTPYF